QSGTEPRDPESKPAGQHAIPVVQRAVPHLSARTVVIRWYARDNQRSPFPIQLKLIGIDPNVHRIVRDEDRKITDHSNSALMAIVAQRSPLSKEQELEELLCGDVIVQLYACVL